MTKKIYPSDSKTPRQPMTTAEFRESFLAYCRRKRGVQFDDMAEEFSEPEKVEKEAGDN